MDQFYKHIRYDPNRKMIGHGEVVFGGDTVVGMS